jgi:hypothetical protein
MIPTTREFRGAAQTDHIVISRVDVIRNGKVVDNLDGTLYDGTVRWDATAAQTSSIALSVADPDGKAPAGLGSELGPFGTWVQAWRGIRIPLVTIVTSFSNNQGNWAPGIHNGTQANVSGALTLA